MPESIHRYLAALPRGDRQVFLSWRLLADEPIDTGYYVQRRRADDDPWRTLDVTPVTKGTCYLDCAPDATQYDYRILAAGVPSETVSVDAGAPATMAAIQFPLPPDDDVDLLILGDLLNDGQMGYVLRVTRENTLWLCAYSQRGQPLWEIDTHLPIQGGWNRHHLPFLAWDVNGDGRTEVAFHNVHGAYAGDDYQAAGGNEFLTVVDGASGEIIWEAPWPAKHPRVMMTVGQLRGPDQPASLVVQDETYGPIWLTAIDGANGAVQWQVEQARAGGHNLDIGDMDGDGLQEVIAGGVCYNGDGTVRWEAEPFGHTDISKPCAIDPSRQGLQIWYAVEKDNPGVYLVDKDGQTLFSEPYRHAHYGWIARHAPGVPGLHPHTAEDARHEYGAVSDGMRDAGHFPIFLPDGSHWLNLTDWQRKHFVPVQWDEGELISFIIRRGDKRIVRLLPSGEIQDLPNGQLPPGGQFGRNLACADVIGDYRENIVTWDTERHCLMVLMNPNLTTWRGRSPYDTFAYRHDRSQLGSGYYVYLAPPYTAKA